MIFLCFSIKDRERIAEKVLNHLLSFGFEVWYDRKDIFLGDERAKTNLLEGAGNSKIHYGVVIISPHFYEGNFCKKELDILWERKKKGEISLFPVFYNILPENIPEEYQFLTDFVCKFISENDNSIFLAYHIVSKISSDSVKLLEIKTIKEFCNIFQNSYVGKVLKLYLSLDRNNYNSKMTTLYALYEYLKIEFDFSVLPAHYYLAFDKLHSFTKLNIRTDLRELQILENMTILLLDYYYQNIIKK